MFPFLIKIALLNAFKPPAAAAVGNANIYISVGFDSQRFICQVKQMWKSKWEMGMNSAKLGIGIGK